MARPFVSILVDTYNHERFIEKALASVLEQDYPAADREIIVVDDGSTDKTPAIIQKFATQVRAIRKRNGGQASAFNAGISECRGEVVAFLDGDDWWAPQKLATVVETFTTEECVGLVGHGIIEVLQDGTERSQTLRETARFRLDSVASARQFRLRKSFLGTSRMAYRAAVLKQIGAVPEALVIQADEYLFTVAGLFAEVLIRREPLTYYRLHDANAFQIADGNAAALRRKYAALSAVAGALRERFQREGIAADITDAVVSCVSVEAELIRLTLESGAPWETISAEWKNYRIMHADVSALRLVLKGASLLPAFLLSSRKYFQLTQKVAGNRQYRRLRARWLPFSRMEHLEQRTPEGS
jgi:hypothetical protein